MRVRSVAKTSVRWALGTLAAFALVASVAGADAGLTIETLQHRFLDGSTGASWGPVWLKATGGAGDYTWSHVAGSGVLPPGISLDPAGRLEGTAPGTVGTYHFTLRVTDENGATAQRAYRIRINAEANVRTPVLGAEDLPFGYIQSAIEVAGDDLPGGGLNPNGTCATPRRFRPQTVEEMKAWVRMYLTHFQGGEVFFHRLRNAVDFERVRRINQAIAEVRSEPGGRDFKGVFTNGRLPGFFFPDELDDQDPTWRAQSLKSNGLMWERRPEGFDPNGGDVFGLHAAHVDLANDEAVDSLMSRLAEAYDHEGPPAGSVGPLNGFWVFNEAKPTPLYRPFAEPAKDGPDNDDLVPHEAPRPTCDIFDIDHAPPMLQGGDPCVLLQDGDVRFSWLAGPKRSVPLFSPAARDKFVAFAAARGVVVTQLPADRNEFNVGSIGLPTHVSFVPLTNTAVWVAWTDWVYDTWFRYLDRMARTITFAQAGNPYFRGILYFQFPGWYSFRAPAKDQVIPYKYFNAQEALVTVTNQRPRDYGEFEMFNNVVHGTDIERFVRSPWIKAFLHETTTPMQGAGASTTDRAGDRAVLTSPRGIYLWNQAGASARLVTNRNHKLFGLFARYFYFGGPNTFLTPEDWTWNWNRIVPLNPPEMMSTLPPQYYLHRDQPEDMANMSAEHLCLVPPYYDNGSSGEAWKDAMRALRTAHHPPAAWNPRSLGSIDTFDGRTAAGWAYDPWSRRTGIEILLTGSPNSCHSGPPIVGVVHADGAASAARDGQIRNTVRTTANYAPPEDMPFEFTIDLVAFLNAAGALCGPGNYQVQLRAQDAQGDGLTGVLPYQGAGTLTVPVQGPSARIIWIQPRALAGFGPPGTLVLAGHASGAPAGTRVSVYWRNNTTRGPWTQNSFQPVPDAGGTWYSAFPEPPPGQPSPVPPVNTSHVYEAYISYGGTISAHCTYRGDNALNSCGLGSTLSVIAARSGAGAGTVTSVPPGISCGADCSQVYAVGTAVTLAAPPASGSVFVGWEGDLDCLDGVIELRESRWCTARFESAGTASVDVIWIQPQALAGFGPPGSLVLAGSASGAPVGTPITLTWRDNTTGGPWTTTAPVPVSGPIWYASIPYAEPSHAYQVFARYGSSASAGCTYAGNGGVTWCP